MSLGSKSLRCDGLDDVLILIKNVFGVFVEVSSEHERKILDVAKEARIPSVNENGINLLRDGGDGVWFVVVVWRASGVGDLAAVVAFDGAVGLFGVGVICELVLSLLFVDK